eukprot:Nitzschia sp. Nitz4//scaffold397_size11424//4392//5576//NITZ4_009040-RA/size11424-processed-gene-0.1-mRNA-1//1//CDS//3329550281//3540//frame0
MKFLLSFLSFGVAAANMPIYGNPLKATTPVDNIPVNSNLGSKIMSQARSLEDAIDFTWVADFSIKFQGCHHISQWNDDADGDEDVRISTKRLVRFRLCPSDSCSSSSGAGCRSAYGDYVIDMNTFLEAYYEAIEDNNKYQCEYYGQQVCDCEDSDDKGDDFDRDICEWNCFSKYNMIEQCDVKNPYNDDEEEEEKFELRDYVECKELEIENDERRLEEEEEVQYFVGPYCAEQGGQIYLGLFTDDTCTAFAGSNGGAAAYAQLTGSSLPYSKQSVISMDCISCKEPEDYNQDGNDAQDGDQVVEMCEQIYQTAGKCEKSLEATGYIYEANNNACNYISGIKVARTDGSLQSVGSKTSKTASVFIGFFVVASVLLVAYVYYLKTKLDRASINLSD